MRKSIGMLWKFYYCDWKKRKLWQKILTPAATFLLMLFLFAFLAYYVVHMYYQTAAFQYGSYDAILLNSTTRQMDEIATYDFIEHFVGYVSIFGVPMEHNGNTTSVDFHAIKSNTLCDVDYTPWYPELAVERDDAIMADASKNPIAISEINAVTLDVHVGDAVTAKLGRTEIEYTVAGIYQDVSMPWECSYVLNQGELLEWVKEIERNSGETGVTAETVPCTHAYVTFNDAAQGKTFLQNYVNDLDLDRKYGENWKELATEEELERYKGDYTTRKESLQTYRDNSAYQYGNVLWLIAFVSLAMAFFIFWERNRTITLTMKPLTVLVAEGCSKASLFAYFFGSTFWRQLGYFLLTIPVIQYPFMDFISYESCIYHFSDFLLWQCLPYVLGLLFAVSLFTGAYLYVKFSRRLVLFTGEE